MKALSPSLVNCTPLARATAPASLVVEAAAPGLDAAPAAAPTTSEGLSAGGPRFTAATMASPPPQPLRPPSTASLDESEATAHAPRDDAAGEMPHALADVPDDASTRGSGARRQRLARESRGSSGASAGPWSAAEDAELTRLVGVHDSDWKTIAAAMPGRSNVDCRKRWVYTVDPAISRAPWSADEVRTLLVEHHRCRLGVFHATSAWDLLDGVAVFERDRATSLISRHSTVDVRAGSEISGPRSRSCCRAARTTWSNTS